MQDGLSLRKNGSGYKLEGIFIYFCIFFIHISHVVFLPKTLHYHTVFFATSGVSKRGMLTFFLHYLFALFLPRTVLYLMCMRTSIRGIIISTSCETYTLFCHPYVSIRGRDV